MTGAKNNFSKNRSDIEKSCIFAVRLQGIMAEWLGEGLQNLLRRFDSVWYLQKTPTRKSWRFFVATSFPVKME